jgi:osmotically-inducible protein OsmY
VVVRQLLQANPIVAPYNLATSFKNGQVVLSGAVGTKQIHDIAVRLAINSGYPIRDDLVINTALAHRVAAAQAQAQAQAQPMLPAQAGGIGTLPYVYPPPLFGRIDDPFFGFEPPILSYPPWWRASLPRGGITPGLAAGNTATSDPAQPIQIPLGPNPQDGVVEMTMDPRGRAILRGNVPTLADRIAIGQKIAQTPGVSEVLNLLDVPARPAGETTPPPPQPGLAPAGPLPPAPAAGLAPAPNAGGAAVTAVVVAEGGAVGDRISQAFARRPALAGLPIRVTVSDGVATLSGKVPTVYEAMLAFRLVERTPGIREVIDRLEFVVPDGERQNPLIKQGRPEDVEPYMTAQIRRNLGDLGHLDRVQVLGDRIELTGTLVHAEDRPRLDAILRSISVLRGYHVEPHFDTD